MSRQKDSFVLLVFMTGVFLTSAAMGVAFYLAGPKSVTVVFSGPAPGAAGAGTATAGAPGGGAGGGGADTAAVAPPQVVMARTTAVPDPHDPFDRAWDKAPVLEVPLQPQAVARPVLETATVARLSVQALRDDRRAAWRLSWAAARPSENVDAGKFTDAVALQLAPDPSTPFVMGGPGKPVHILHWKALWQKDIDQGYQDVQHLHPNFWADLYWFAEGKFPFPVGSSFKSKAARQYLVAMSAGNPMARPDRTSPVEEIVAQGFGSATTVPGEASGGKGVWKDGHWTVVIDRPLAGDDAIARILAAKAPASIAFAVWDGSAQNVGARKHYCVWVPLKVEP